MLLVFAPGASKFSPPEPSLLDMFNKICKEVYKVPLKTGVM